MNPELQQLTQRIDKIENAMRVLSDRVVFSRDIYLQKGRQLRSTYIGRVYNDGTPNSPFPSGWSVTENSTGNYTVTHNLNNADCVVVCQFIDSNGANVAAGLAVTTDTNSFTVDFATSGGVHFIHEFFFVLFT